MSCGRAIHILIAGICRRASNDRSAEHIPYHRHTWDGVCAVDDMRWERFWRRYLPWFAVIVVITLTIQALPL